MSGHYSRTRFCDPPHVPTMLPFALKRLGTRDYQGIGSIVTWRGKQDPLVLVGFCYTNSLAGKGPRNSDHIHPSHERNLIRNPALLSLSPPRSWVLAAPLRHLSRWPLKCIAQLALLPMDEGKPRLIRQRISVRHVATLVLRHLVEKVLVVRNFNQFSSPFGRFVIQIQVIG